jgi:hypothetical protein
MTRDDIIRMAREAGITFVTEVGVASATPEWIERFAALVAAAEREACAEICDEQMEIREINTAMAVAAGNCADAIRARGDK